MCKKDQKVCCLINMNFLYGTFTDKEEGKYKVVYPIFTVQKLMNHKDIQQTMCYAKLAPDSSRDMVEGLYQ